MRIRNDLEENEKEEEKEEEEDKGQKRYQNKTRRKRRKSRSEELPERGLKSSVTSQSTEVAGPSSTSGAVSSEMKSVTLLKGSSLICYQS